MKNAGNFCIPDDAYDSLREQYLASRILGKLNSERADSHYTLGLVDVDLYVPDLNFIFGQADPLEQTAIVSLHRLKGERIIARLRTEVVHEVGHLLGLVHCAKPSCVMFFSNTIADSDRKGEELCSECKRRLR